MLCMIVVGGVQILHHKWVRGHLTFFPKEASQHHTPNRQKLTKHSTSAHCQAHSSQLSASVTNVPSSASYSLRLSVKTMLFCNFTYSFNSYQNLYVKVFVYLQCSSLCHTKYLLPAVHYNFYWYMSPVAVPGSLSLFFDNTIYCYISFLESIKGHSNIVNHRCVDYIVVFSS